MEFDLEIEIGKESEALEKLKTFKESDIPEGTNYFKVSATLLYRLLEARLQNGML